LGSFDPVLIWLIALIGYTLSRFGEWRIHRFNYQYLREIGAEELIPGRMRHYYSMVFLLLPVAVGEHLLLRQPIWKEMIIGGLFLVAGGLALRLWAIRSLGRLWSMRCLGLTGAPVVRRGPYFYFENPEYASRVMDGLGLFLIIGARWTGLLYLIWSIILLLRIVSIEERQLRELNQSGLRHRAGTR
jgi:methyltransferase